MGEGSNKGDGKKSRAQYLNAPKPQRPTQSRYTAENEEEDEDRQPRAGPSKPARSKVATTSKATSAPDAAAPPKKKKKRELQLPDARTDDAEDGEIEWLEYALRKEKGKAKEEDSDGLDGKFR